MGGRRPTLPSARCGISGGTPAQNEEAFSRGRPCLLGKVCCTLQFQDFDRFYLLGRSIVRKTKSKFYALSKVVRKSEQIYSRIYSKTKCFEPMPYSHMDASVCLCGTFVNLFPPKRKLLITLSPGHRACSVPSSCRDADARSMLSTRECDRSIFCGSSVPTWGLYAQQERGHCIISPLHQDTGLREVQTLLGLEMEARMANGSTIVLSFSPRMARAMPEHSGQTQYFIPEVFYLRSILRESSRKLAKRTCHGLHSLRAR